MTGAVPGVNLQRAETSVSPKGENRQSNLKSVQKQSAQKIHQTAFVILYHFIPQTPQGFHEVACVISRFPQAQSLDPTTATNSGDAMRQLYVEICEAQKQLERPARVLCEKSHVSQKEKKEIRDNTQARDTIQQEKKRQVKT